MAEGLYDRIFWITGALAIQMCGYFFAPTVELGVVFMVLLADLEVVFALAMMFLYDLPSITEFSAWWLLSLLVMITGVATAATILYEWTISTLPIVGFGIGIASLAVVFEQRDLKSCIADENTTCDVASKSLVVLFLYEIAPAVGICLFLLHGALLWLLAPVMGLAISAACVWYMQTYTRIEAQTEM